MSEEGQLGRTARERKREDEWRAGAPVAERAKGTRDGGRAKEGEARAQDRKPPPAEAGPKGGTREHRSTLPKQEAETAARDRPLLQQTRAVPPHTRCHPRRPRRRSTARTPIRDGAQLQLRRLGRDMQERTFGECTPSHRTGAGLLAGAWSWTGAPLPCPALEGAASHCRGPLLRAPQLTPHLIPPRPQPSPAVSIPSHAHRNSFAALPSRMPRSLSTARVLALPRHRFLPPSQMPVCSLFLRQQLNLLPPASYPGALALPSDPQLLQIALASAGVGVRAVCALPRMASAGGYPGSAGNAANIAFCALGIIVGVYFAFRAGRRQAAVGRAEMRIFFAIFALQCLFQILSTGSFLEQNSKGIVWVTSIHLGLVLLLYVVPPRFRFTTQLTIAQTQILDAHLGLLP